ncbi:MAG TPA: RES family NAD+ phosphorylase [Spongiibacteraceae bacterium]|nr:RES family NAD+ phosphorylase [Spongiibacteraceae bacterium]
MIWEACNGPDQITSVEGRLLRLVESQEQIATLGYVDTLEEQALLEDLLEEAKPPYPEDWSDYHYLLKTPFRYPPLQWGSRFGSLHEQSIFYGGSSIDSTLAESAYYRWVFWFSIDAPPVKDKIRTEHTLFSVGYKTRKGIRLQIFPFDQYADELTHPQNYSATQTLGSAMRTAGVEAFEYLSARNPKQGMCVGLFSPQAFTQKRPEETSQWLCEVSATEVSFKQVGSKPITKYLISDFLFQGRLPLPPA